MTSDARGTHDDLMALSKDVGKLAERTGRLEEGFGRFEKTVEDGFEALQRREDERAVQDKARAERDAKVADHIRQVCALAKVGMWFIKFCVPTGGAFGIWAAGRAMGWW